MSSGSQSPTGGQPDTHSASQAHVVLAWVMWSFAMLLASGLVGLAAGVLRTMDGASIAGAVTGGAAAAAGTATLWCVVTAVLMTALRRQP
ncbi:hypothetical protein GCM10009557_12340 [Virgisporangium ochraceum]|uniref:Uncharacterized protein n=1 Tax=Virgisporangium ochraceum TaxID=65505 RepID=A0A8J4A499_9ACTN|nr:hypothetical protein Voc01_103410 [Virgisporangium ochraceum]